MGKQAYAVGDYKLAATAFDEAYQRLPRPQIAFSAAQAYRLQYAIDPQIAHVHRALELYQRYIAEVPIGGRRDDAASHIFTLKLLLAKQENRTDPDGAARASRTTLALSSRTKEALASVDGADPRPMPFSIEVAPGAHKVGVTAPGYFPDAIEATAVEGAFVVVPIDLRAMPAKLTVNAPDGAEIRVDGRLIDLPPGNRSLEMTAGTYDLAVTDTGRRPFTRELILERGQVLAINPELETTDQRRAAYFVLAGAGALAVGGAIGAIVALDQQAQARALGLPEVGTTSLSESAAAARNRAIAGRDDARTAAYVLFGGAAVAAATGGLMYLFDRATVDAPRARAAPIVTPIVTPDTIGAAVSGTID